MSAKYNVSWDPSSLLSSWRLTSPKIICPSAIVFIRSATTRHRDILSLQGINLKRHHNSISCNNIQLLFIIIHYYDLVV